MFQFSNNTFKIEWNKNLTSTAGRTNCVSKKEVYRNVDGSKGSKVVDRFATIELATKILDSAGELAKLDDRKNPASLFG